MLRLSPLPMALLSLAVSSGANAQPDAHSYLATCLTIGQVKNATQSHPTAFSRTDKPQPGCSYNDAEVIAKQTNISYSRDPAYNVPFNIKDLMQPVTGLGKFAEYEADTGRLYVNLGPDGIVFEGRIGKTPLSLARLTALAHAVLASANR